MLSAVVPPAIQVECRSARLEYAVRLDDLTARGQQSFDQIAWIVHDVNIEPEDPVLIVERVGELRQVRVPTGADATRRGLAHDVLQEVRTLERAIGQLDTQLEAAILASGSSVLQLHGVGIAVAAILLGHIGDIRRFPTAGHFATYCGVAPLEASSGDVIRHRLSRLGDRQLNSALYIMALTQARSHPLGRAYYLRKQTEGHSKAEALRCLKRRLADVVYRCLRRDADTHATGAAEGQARPPATPMPAWQRTKNARRGLHRGKGNSL